MWKSMKSEEHEEHDNKNGDIRVSQLGKVYSQVSGRVNVVSGCTIHPCADLYPAILPPGQEYFPVQGHHCIDSMP